MNDDSAVSAVLDFWFGTPGPDGLLPKREAWFRKDADFDAAIRERFLALHERARRGELGAWRAAPRGMLALIVLTDQFPRNMFRGDARMYSTDQLALDCAKETVKRGWDRQFVPIQRWFVYLPYEHSEILADQEECLRLFASLTEDPQLADVSVWAQKHLDIVARFGRFPHRNAILGRASTAEEIEFLKQPGSSF